jgi:hypothetical protein
MKRISLLYEELKSTALICHIRIEKYKLVRYNYVLLGGMSVATQ